MEKNVQKFKVDGMDVIFRHTEIKDAKGIFLMQASLYKEKAMTAMNNKPEFKRVKERLTVRIKEAKNKETADLVVDVGGQIMGRAMVFKSKDLAQRHIGTLAIHLEKEIREKGIGGKLLDAVIKEAKNVLKVKMIILGVIAENKKAVSFYKKKGFKQYGKLNKGVQYLNKLADDLLMVKYL